MLDVRALLALLLAALLGACSPPQVITCRPNEAYDPVLKVCYKCDPGEKVNHATATCVPDPNWKPPQDTTGDEDTPAVEDVLTPPDTGDVPDTGETADLPDGAEEQTGNPDAVPPGAVGAACYLDKDCSEDAVCFDWPGGYCTVLGCTGTEGCPEGTACLPLLENGTGCFDRCTAPGECRPGYGCKGIPNATGGAEKICYPVGEDNLPAGAACEDHGDCTGDLSCVHLGGGFRCTKVGCGMDTACPETDACIWLGWVTACLTTCTTTADCVALGDALVCEEREDLSEEPVDVCTTPSAGLPLGSACSFAAECQTGVCNLMVVGTCSDSGAPCSSDQACQMGVCIADPSVQSGVCTDYCSSTEFCEEGGLCVSMGGPSLVCASSCGGATDPCGPQGMGMSCVYGDPVYPPASGKYACTLVTSGLGGTPCEDDLQCTDGACYRPEGGDGFCATLCGLGVVCPFGAICVQKTDAFVCMRRCQSTFDCGDGFTCTSTTYAAKSICVLDTELL